jgi:hypothetical protein
MPVDTAPLIPPAFRFIRIDINRDHIFFIKPGNIGDVHLKGCIAAKITMQQTTVNIDGTLAGDSFKIQGDPAVSIGFFQGKMLPIPCVLRLEIPMCTVINRFGSLQNDIIMGQAYIFPGSCTQDATPIVSVEMIVVVPAAGSPLSPLRFGVQIGATL